MKQAYLLIVGFIFKKNLLTNLNLHIHKMVINTLYILFLSMNFQATNEAVPKAPAQKAPAKDKKSKKAKPEDEEGDQIVKGKEIKTLGPQVQDNELVFGVAHILATWNDTFIHVTDLSGRETLVRVTGK